MTALTATVQNNAGKHRYELLVGGDLVGKVLYRANHDVVYLIHTEVAPALEGQGLGEQLVTGALDDIRMRHLHVVPICPYVAAYLERHPEYGYLVEASRAT